MALIISLFSLATLCLEESFIEYFSEKSQLTRQEQTCQQETDKSKFLNLIFD